jgi:hypothetical protein
VSADDDTGPRRISDREVPVNLTGYFTPTHGENVPVLMGMPGTDDLFMFVFSTEEKLRAAMESFGVEYERIAQVTDGKELLADLAAQNATGERPYQLRLAIDPHKATNGRVQFVEPLASIQSRVDLLNGEVVVDLPPPAPRHGTPRDEKPVGNALSTMEHADGCKVVRENGVSVWMCVGSCPAMYEFIASGQCDNQPWDKLDASQRRTVIDTVSKHAIGALDARDEKENKP